MAQGEAGVERLIARDLATPIGQGMRHTIKFTEDAELDLEFFRVFDRRIITEGIRTQLTYEPLVETRNRKRLRENPLAPWELRIQKYRVFYGVEDELVVIG